MKAVLLLVSAALVLVALPAQAGIWSWLRGRPATPAPVAQPVLNPLATSVPVVPAAPRGGRGPLRPRYEGRVFEPARDPFAGDFVTGSGRRTPIEPGDGLLRANSAIERLAIRQEETRVTMRTAIELAKAGRYAEAIAMIESVRPPGYSAEGFTSTTFKSLIEGPLEPLFHAVDAMGGNSMYMHPRTTIGEGGVMHAGDSVKYVREAYVMDTSPEQLQAMMVAGDFASVKAIGQHKVIAQGPRTPREEVVARAVVAVAYEEHAHAFLGMGEADVAMSLHGMKLFRSKEELWGFVHRYHERRDAFAARGITFEDQIPLPGL